MQEPECETEGGTCKDLSGCDVCDGEILDSKCPTQPEAVKCCVEVEEVENCEENNNPCVQEKKRRKRSTCTSRPK